MIQWVASPLNQNYPVLTGMTAGEGETEEGGTSQIAEVADDDTNLGTSTIHSLRIVH
jgi:hypothetical protein